MSSNNQAPETRPHEPAAEEGGYGGTRPATVSHGRASAFFFRLAGAAFVALAAVGVIVIRTHKHKAAADEGAAREAASAQGPLVQAAKVVTAPPTRTVTLSGDVQPFAKSTLYAKISGYVRAIRVDKGDRVKANDIIGIVESPETEQDVASGRADLALKKMTEERFRALSHEGLVSNQDLEQAIASEKISAAALQRLTVLQGYEVIRAPYDGVIVARYADPGALLQAATASTSALPLVDVAKIDVLRVYVYLGQGEALFVHEGDAVTLWADQRPNDKIKAKITRFSKQLDPRTRTMLTEIDVDNADGKLYPGTFVRVSLTLASPATLAVPQDAVFTRDGHALVGVVRDGKVTFTPVQTGDTDGRNVRITSGLHDGDVVGLHLGDEVADGAPVRVIMK